MENKTIKWTAIAALAAVCVFIIYSALEHDISDPESLRLYFREMGIAAPAVFMLIQAVQVVIPVIPGGVISGVGVIVFGPLAGAVYNYIGSLAGCVMAFRLVKKYGKAFILTVADEKAYNKYIGWLDCGKKFEIFFALAVLLPGMPDDLLCMIAALTSISERRYMLINILCKPAGIIIYSLGVDRIADLV